MTSTVCVSFRKATPWQWLWGSLADEPVTASTVKNLPPYSTNVTQHMLLKRKGSSAKLQSLSSAWRAFPITLIPEVSDHINGV